MEKLLAVKRGKVIFAVLKMNRKRIIRRIGSSVG
jgi:hypothetical protein